MKKAFVCAGIALVAALSMCGCSSGNTTEQPDSQAAQEQTSSNDAQLANDYLNVSEVQGFLAAAQNITDAHSALQNGDSETCLSLLEGTTDACKALSAMEDVPEVVSEVHEDFTKAADSFQTASIGLMAGAMSDDQDARNNALETTIQQINDATEYLNDATAAINRLPVKTSQQ